MTEHEMDGRMRDWLSTRDPGVVPDRLRLSAAEVPFQVRPGLALGWPRLSRPVAILLLLVLLAALTAAVVIVGSSARAEARNGLVAFVASDGDVYVAAEDGSGLTRVTTTPEIESTPAWSPDGGRLAFLRSAAHPTSCAAPCGSVAVYDRSGTSESTFLVDESAPLLSVSWSPDGRYLSYCAGFGRLIDRCEHPGVIDAATGKAQDLGQVPGDIAWSPDGRWLLFLTGAIELIPLDRATGVSIVNAMSLSPPDSGIALEASWAPDSQRLVFSSSPSGEIDDARIEVMRVDGTDASVLTEDAFGPQWSPDGTAIAFERIASSSAPFEFEVWVMAPDGTNQHLLATATSALRWSPDGSQLYFQEAGSLYAVKPDGTGLHRLLITSSATPAVDEENDMLNADWQAVLP